MGGSATMKKVTRKEAQDIKNPIPSKPGTYWARVSARWKWFHLIIKVSGDAPFMECSVLADMTDLCTEEDIINPADISWGPELLVPEPEFYTH